MSAGWCSAKRLCIPGCCRAGSHRIGEASNPGPPQHRAVPRGSLEGMPLLSSGTQALEAKQLAGFLQWCEVELNEVDLGLLFDLVRPSWGKL